MAICNAKMSWIWFKKFLLPILNNYIFKNNGNLTFQKMSVGELRKPSNSNGAAYADLDNDGDLDLIVNNINQAAFIYQNEC